MRHFLVFQIFPSKNTGEVQGLQIRLCKRPNKEMMEAATRGITKAGTSEQKQWGSGLMIFFAQGRIARLQFLKEQI